MIWTRPELRVLFVCTANVCRSPLAQALLRHRLQVAGLAARVQVRSAGTQTMQSGRRPDPRVEQLAAEAGISLARISSRKLTKRMIKGTDHVLVMEQAHLKDVSRLWNDDDYSDACPDNVQLLGCYLPADVSGMGSPDIPDPYFGDLPGFFHVYDLIDSAVAGFMAQVIEKGR